MDVLTQIRQSRMTRFQVMAVVIALTLILIDGFDVAVMAYAAPSLSRAWGLDPVTLGFLLSASLFGMAAGSIFLTPLADKIGRRKLALISLVIISIGMVLSVFAADAMQLMAFRIVTGLGVGGMMANLNVLVSEYSSDKRRGTIIGIYAAGYPIGATVGGLVAAPLIPLYGWHSVFIVGAALTVLMLAHLLALPARVPRLPADPPPGRRAGQDQRHPGQDRPPGADGPAGPPRSRPPAERRGRDPEPAHAFPHPGVVDRLRLPGRRLLLREHLDAEDRRGGLRQ